MVRSVVVPVATRRVGWPWFGPLLASTGNARRACRGPSRHPRQRLEGARPHVKGQPVQRQYPAEGEFAQKDRRRNAIPPSAPPHCRESWQTPFGNLLGPWCPPFSCREATGSCPNRPELLQTCSRPARHATTAEPRGCRPHPLLDDLNGRGAALPWRCRPWTIVWRCAPWPASHGSVDDNTSSTAPSAGDSKKISSCPPVGLVAKIRACNTRVSLAHKPSTPSANRGKALQRARGQCAFGVIHHRHARHALGSRGCLAMASSGKSY